MVQSVVFLHGLRTSSTMWRFQERELADRGYSVFAPDLPGHGTRMQERFSVDAATETIGQAVSAAPGEVFVCGFSLGAYLAMHYAGLESRPVAGLLLASCGTQPYRVVLDAWRAAAAVIHRFPDRGLGFNNLAVRIALKDPDRVADVLDGGVALEVMPDALRELRKVRPLRSLARIDQPVWLVNGQFDHFRLEERRYLKAAPNARLVHVSGATHMVSLARPEPFTRILLDAIGVVS